MQELVFSGGSHCMMHEMMVVDELWIGGSNTNRHVVLVLQSMLHGGKPPPFSNLPHTINHVRARTWFAHPSFSATVVALPSSDHLHVHDQLGSPSMITNVNTCIAMYDTLSQSIRSFITSVVGLNKIGRPSLG